MNVKPLVSLLVANYNNAEFIVETLNSAIGQTYSNIEIIILDDASEDNSVRIVEQYILEHPEDKIELFRNNCNSGCGGAKRKCIEMAHGDYFAFLDPEDTIEPTAVEELMLIHLLDRFEYSIVYCTHYLCNEKLEVQSVSDWPGRIPEGESHLTSTGGHISAFTVCSKLFYDKTEGINPYFVVAEDQDLYLKMEEVALVYFLNKPLYYYRKHNNNVSWSDSKRWRNLFWYHQAEMAAYRRRKKGRTVAINYTKAQIDKRNFSYHLQMGKYYRKRKEAFHCLKEYFRAIKYVYTFIK